MSVRVSTWAWEQSVRGSRKLVLLALADQANDAGGCYPGQKTLATKCGMSERALQGHLAALEAGGYIRRERRHRGDGTRTSDQYTLVLPADSACRDADQAQILRDLPADSRTPNPQSLRVLKEEPSVREPSEETSSLRSDVVEPDRLDAGASRLQAEVNELFAYWQQQCGHPHAKLTPERKRAVKARRKQGYTVEQIKTAIDGAAKAAHVDERGRRFDDLELICRTGTKLESFIERAASVEVGKGLAVAGQSGRRESPSDLLRALGAA